MNAMTLEPLLRDATIKAIDGVAKKLSQAEREAESKVTRLLKYWNQMEPAEKEHAVGIAIATVTTRRHRHHRPEEQDQAVPP